MIFTIEKLRYRSLSDISILITLALKRSRSLKFCNHEAKQVTDKNNEKKKRKEEKNNHREEKKFHETVINRRRQFRQKTRWKSYGK